MVEDINDYYGERLDKIFGRGSTWPHRTFRTILDPYSNEWEGTSMGRKIEILEKVVEAGESLEMLIFNYKCRYIEKNRKDIAGCVDTALARILEYQLRKSY